MLGQLRDGAAPRLGHGANVVDDRADVGGSLGSVGAQRIAVHGVLAHDGGHTGRAGDRLNGLGVVGVFRKERDRAGLLDGRDGLGDVVGGGVLLFIEVGQGGADEADPVVPREVAESVVGSKKHALALRHSFDRLRGPLIERVDVLQVRGRGCIDRRGGVRRCGCKASAEVGDLDAGALRGGPHVRVEAEFGLLAGLFGRERPRGNVDALVSAVDRVGGLRVGRAGVVDVGGGQDAGGDDHAPVEAGGGNRVVQEVLEVDAGDGHDVSVGQGRGLSRGHLVLVRGGVGGEQAGQAHGEGGPLRGGAHVAALSGCVGLVKGNLGRMSRDLGDVVADLRGCGDDCEAVCRGGGRARR